MALIRYPGSKERIAPQIISHFPPEIDLPLWVEMCGWEYREPFFGAGAIGFRMIQRLPRECPIWLNDIDYGIYCLWFSIWKDLPNFLDKLETFEPSVKAFNLFKEEDGRDDLGTLESGFRKVALHQMSFSGLGAKAGGPLGGKEQSNSDYDVTCRWSYENLATQAKRLHKLLATHPNLKITCLDFAKLIDDNPAVFLYLDPPYYLKGAELYAHPMKDKDHERLQDRLRKTHSSWVLSYDDHPEIRRLYGWANFTSVDIVYTTATATAPQRRKNQEVLIMPKHMKGGH